MYMQITTKCNMRCAHCGYSCNKNGKHMDYYVACDAIAFSREWEDGNSIDIGGGEPTLHPRFFDILAYCVEDFESVWMATNGSRTARMRRLINILDGEDYQDEIKTRSIFPSEFGLRVELSIDPYHSNIDNYIEKYWKRQTEKRNPRYGIRNTSHSLINAGRAKRNQLGIREDCICDAIFINPDGNIKCCGCAEAPIIGDVHHGMKPQWKEYVKNNDHFGNYRCIKKIPQSTLLKLQ